MVYIRAKKVKGDQYLYLVRSVWDSKRNTSKQEIVKYLGNAADVTKDDLPKEYQNNSKIISFLAAHSPEDIKKNEEAIKKTRKSIYKKFTDGDIHGALAVYEEYTSLFELDNFFDKVFRPVMIQIGDEWKSGKMDIATEHVASNIAQTLVKIIMDKVTINHSKKKIFICVPIGEEHHLGCDVIESFLTTKGYKIFNMAASVPIESIIRYIKDNKPDVVLISITLKDNIKSGQRMVKRIREECNTPIIVGGFALENDDSIFDANVTRNFELNQLPKLIRDVLAR